MDQLVDELVSYRALAADAPAGGGRQSPGSGALVTASRKVGLIASNRTRSICSIPRAIATFLTLTRPSTTGGEARLLLGHGEGSVATLDQARQAAAEGAKQGRNKVIIQADSEVPHGEVLKVAGAVAQVEGVTVHLGVQEMTGAP